MPMRRSPLQLLLSAALSALAAAALLVPGAAAAKPQPHPKPPPPPTKITVNRWAGETLSGSPYNAKPFATATHCATDPMKTLDLYGGAKHVVDGRHFVVQFLLNGTVRDVFHEHWSGTGFGHYSDGIVNKEGLPDGRWSVKIVQGGKTIGFSWVLLAADPSC